MDEISTTGDHGSEAYLNGTVSDARSLKAIDRQIASETSIWAFSSAGRALPWHGRGQRFDPAKVHQ